VPGSRESEFIESCDGGLLIVARLVLCRRHVADRTTQPLMIEPLHTGQRREFDVVEVREVPCDESLRFEQPDHRLGERVGVRVPRQLLVCFVRIET
jgi:hypothetical protein